MQNRGALLHRLWSRHAFNAKTLLGEPRLTGGPVDEWTMTRVHDEQFITSTSRYTSIAPPISVSTSGICIWLIAPCYESMVKRTRRTMTFAIMVFMLQLQNGTLSTVKVTRN